MWLLLAGVGAWLGQASGALMGALLGGLIGHLITQINALRTRVADLERRMASAVDAGPRPAPVERPVERPPDTAAIAPGPAPGQEPATSMAGIATRRTAIPQTSQARTPVAVQGRPHVQEDPPAAARRETATATATATPEQWLSRLLAGNLLAKLGIAVLFFGAASGLKLAAEHGVFPPALRLIAAVLTGLSFIWAGAAPATGRPFRPAWLFRATGMSSATRSGFGFALEGGGFGLLYLAVYFALAFYHYIEPATAFLLFAALGVACIALALRQEGQALALLGLSGAFLAPALAGGEGRHLVLFAYIVLLDAFILWSSLRRGWRALVLAGFALSVLLGLGWAERSYRPELRPDVEVFVILLLALFSLTPILATRRGGLAQWGWRSASLLFGPPAAAAAAQSALYVGDPDRLALSSLLAGLWYGLLWQGTRRTGDAMLAQAVAGLAIAFISLSPLLAFSHNTAGVFWALEGAGLVWYAQRAHRALPLAAGILLQGLSGLLLSGSSIQGPAGLPFRNDLFHAGMLLVAAGSLTTYALRDRPLPGRLALLWTLAWWFGLWYRELDHLMRDAQVLVAMLLLAAVTFLACERAGRHWPMVDLRRASLLLLPAAVAITLLTHARIGHPLGEGLWLVLPITLAVLYDGLRRHEEDGLHWLVPDRHVLLYWFVAWIPAWEIHWQAARLPALGGSLAEALRGLWLAAPLLLVLLRGAAWPFVQHRDLYLRHGLALPVLTAWAWLLSWPVAQTGGWALPYMPLLNPLELSALLLLWTLHRHWLTAGRPWLEHGYPALFPLTLLLWLSGSLARCVHHWAGVPYLPGALWHSDLLQALLSFAWTAFALFGMVLASRRRLRTAWFAGLALLSVVGLKLLLVDLANVSGLLRVLSLMGIGLLVLGAGYLAPVPPRKQEDPAPVDPVP